MRDRRENSCIAGLRKYLAGQRRRDFMEGAVNLQRSKRYKKLPCWEDFLYDADERQMVHFQSQRS